MSNQSTNSTIWNQLTDAADEYAVAKTQFDETQIRFEVAKKRLAVTKQLASGIMAPNEWAEWLERHDAVRYAGTSLGDAIVEALGRHASEIAYASTITEERGQSVRMNLDQILRALRLGGFEFRTITPLREINAALINRSGVEKCEEDSTYTVANLDELIAEASEAANEELRKA